MANEATLKAEARVGTGKGVARKLRAVGKLPAVVYGGGTDVLHLSLDTHDAELLFHRISVDNTIIDIEVDSEKEPIPTLVRDIQTHPWKASLLHVDFLRIQKGVAIEVDIPLHLTGIPTGVSVEGGVIEQIVHDLSVRCIPSKIPESIQVDVTELALGDVMHVSDLTLGEGVEAMMAPGQTICMVSQPRAEVVAETTGDEEGKESAEGAEGVEGGDDAS
ncbi:MAG: 50S ribosomal protein L25 [Longimicrobiales bacterium]|jgi:large subunit ribosomal protein L25